MDEDMVSVSDFFESLSDGCKAAIYACMIRILDEHDGVNHSLALPFENVGSRVYSEE